jgi:hypothetical protein
MLGKIRFESKGILCLVSFLVLLGAWRAGFAQHWANPDFECHLLELRDLGYPQVNMIPANCSAITSLVTGPGGKIYGATSGDTAYLFMYDPTINKVRHLGKLAGHEGVFHSLVIDKEGFIYIGTGKNVLAPVEISNQIGTGDDAVDRSLWNDIKKQYKGYKGGHLLQYDAKKNDGKVYLPENGCPVKDLGVAIGGDGIYALTINAEKNIIYGLTYPNGHMFEYDIATKKFTDLGKTNEKIVFHGPERNWRTLPRALVCDDLGRVFTSGSKGMLHYYDPGKKAIVKTGIKIPGEYYPVQAYEGYPTVEYFVKDSNGLIYGATCDGFLFSFEADKMKLRNLGKPRMTRRIRALTIGRNGKVYMIAGQQLEPGRLFSYNPQDSSFRDLGLMAVDRSPYYSWRGDQFDCMTTGLDGVIYAGESDRRAHLFLYMPLESPPSK